MAFVSGALVGVLVLLTVVADDALLFHVHVSEHNLLWHLGILSTVFAASRGWAAGSEPPPPDDNELLLGAGGGGVAGVGVNEGANARAAEVAMGRVAEHTHYHPEQWRGHCGSFQVRGLG